MLDKIEQIKRTLAMAGRFVPTDEGKKQIAAASNIQYVRTIGPGEGEFVSIRDPETIIAALQMARRFVPIGKERIDEAIDRLQRL